MHSYSCWWPQRGTTLSRPLSLYIVWLVGWFIFPLKKGLWSIRWGAVAATLWQPGCNNRVNHTKWSLDRMFEQCFPCRSILPVPTWTLSYTLWILSLTFKREAEEQERKGSQKLCYPPFSQKSSDFPQMPNTDQICMLPCTAWSNRIVQFLEIPFPGKSRQAQHCTPVRRLGSCIPQVEGAAILQIRGLIRGTFGGVC